MLKIRFKMIASTLFALLFAVYPCTLVYGEKAEQPLPSSSASQPVNERTEASDDSLQAEQVTLHVSASDPSMNCKKVLDNREKTKLFASEKTVFDVSADREFENLYLKFENNCNWVITLPDGEKLTPKEEDYIHKYLPLGKSVSSFKLTLPKYGGLTEIYAFTDGQLPDWVQIWQPPCERADLMVMPTHADDE